MKKELGKHRAAFRRRRAFISHLITTRGYRPGELPWLIQERNAIDWAIAQLEDNPT